MMPTFLFFVLTTAGPVCDASCLVKYLDEASILQLVDATDLDSLIRSYSSLPYRDSVAEIVFCSRLLELKPGRDADDCLLKTMPRSPLEVWYFYALTYTKSYKESAGLVRIVNGYYGDLARAVVRRKNGMRPFLLLKRFSDGELAEDLRDWDEYLCRQAHRSFVEALRGLDSETQRRVCGECSILRARNGQECNLGE